MVDKIWCYEKDIQDDPEKRWPLCPTEFYEVEINFDFTDEDRINEIVEDVEKIGADTIIVCPDFVHHKGHLNPHISAGFSDEEQAKKCARKYTGGSYGAPSDFAIPGVKDWRFAPLAR